jgi:predicted dehydrogenase
MKQTTLAVLVGNRGFFPDHLCDEGRKEVLASRGIGCYDSVQMHLSFAEGFATLETSWIVPRSWPTLVDFVVSLQATEGRADMDMSRQGTTIADAARYAIPMLSGKEPVDADDFGFLSLPIRRFVRAILTGAESPMPLEDGLKNVQILAAVHASLAGGGVIEVDYTSA